MKVEFFKHNIDKSDIDRVVKVLESPFLSTGAEVEEFEQKLAQYLGCKYVIGVTSCTAALHLSLVALGIKEGDEVITTPMSFIATSNAILYSGAKVRFVDVEPLTGNIDIDLLKRVINKNTKAILPVHLYGQPCKLQSIRQFADKHGLKVIVDAAHALEFGHSLSDTTCYSFYPTKSITSGEGGAIATNNEELACELRSLRLHGMDSTAIDRYHKEYKHWDMIMLGWKYNMNNIQATLLINQIDRLKGYHARRVLICKKYEKGFLDNENISYTITLPPHCCHLFTILVKNRDSVIQKLNEKGIGVAVNYRPIHLMSYYQSLGYKREDFPIAENIGDMTLSLPLYPKLTNEEIEYVIKSVNEAV